MIPSLSDAVVAHVVARAEGLPGRVRAIVTRLSRAPAVAPADVDRLLAAAAPPETGRGAHDEMWVDSKPGLSHQDAPDVDEGQPRRLTPTGRLSWSPPGPRADGVTPRRRPAGSALSPRARTARPPAHPRRHLRLRGGAPRRRCPKGW